MQALPAKKVARPTSRRSVGVYRDLMWGMTGIVGGVVVRVRCMGLERSWGRRREVDCLSGATSEERRAVFIFGMWCLSDVVVCIWAAS